MSNMFQSPLRWHPSSPRPAVQRPRIPVHPAFPCAQEIARAPEWIAAYAQARIANIASLIHVALGPFEPGGAGAAPAPALMDTFVTSRAMQEAARAYAFLKPYYPELAGCFQAWCASVGLYWPQETFNALSNEEQGTFTIAQLGGSGGVAQALSLSALSAGIESNFFGGACLDDYRALTPYQRAVVDANLSRALSSDPSTRASILNSLADYFQTSNPSLPRMSACLRASASTVHAELSSSARRPPYPR